MHPESPLPTQPGGATPPRIVFFGDPHGDLDSVVRVTQEMAPQAIVLLGDIEARKPLQLELAPVLDSTEVWWIPGNHDTDCEASFDNLWGSTLADRNLHGRVATVAGLQVAGLGGVFRESIWDPRLPAGDARFASVRDLHRHLAKKERWRNGISLRHRSSIFPDELQRLARRRADILVTHEALGGVAYGHAVLDGLALALGARLVVHGHLHRDIDYAREGFLPAHSPFKAIGVDAGAHLCWP